MEQRVAEFSGIAGLCLAPGMAAITYAIQCFMMLAQTLSARPNFTAYLQSFCA